MEDHYTFFAPFSPPGAPFLLHPLDESGGGESETEELRRLLARATLELESARASAQEELRRMESHALHLAALLSAAARERDEARAQCRSLLVLLLHNQKQHQQQPPSFPDPPVEDEEEEEGSNNVGASPAAAEAEAELEAAAERRGLPEKGRLLEAVVRAGPLLQTLMLAGPLPEWRHPPPAVHSFEIPPVNVPHVNRNHGSNDENFNTNNNSSSSSESGGSRKNQKLAYFHP